LEDIVRYTESTNKVFKAYFTERQKIGEQVILFAAAKLLIVISSRHL